ncbi:TPA: hypothetical protein ACH3X3_002579 [Trebouxia sp. C0006]
MTDAEGAAPAAKLHKAADGDVTGSSRGEMQAVTPQLQTLVDNANQAESGNVASPPQTTAAASKNDGGKKRKVALYVAYIGAGYHGMQRNPGYPSIEGELEKAICKAGGISEANAESFTKINWMRAARTDKGVSAVGQLVSLKMVVGHTTYDVIENINKHLPAQIRVLGYTKTTAGFDARKHCDKRRYEYVLPAWAFDPDACRSRLCVEEAELRSAANPTEANGVLPSAANPTAADDVIPQAANTQSPTVSTSESSVPADPLGQPQQASTADAIAEATAAAVASEAVTKTESAPDSQSAAASTAQADAPQPTPTEAAIAAGQGPGPDQNSPLQATLNGVASASASFEHSPSCAAGPFQNGLAQGTSTGPAIANGVVHEDVPSNSHPPGDPTPASGGTPHDDSAPGDALSPAPDANQPPPSSFVFNEAATRRLTTILRQYEGTHNFHNFTVKLEATDPSAKRYMLSCQCAGTFEIQGQQWVRIVIIGQSFMLHQIRKMVGMAVAIMRGDAPANCIKIGLQPKRAVPTPMAPDIGLFLDECYYDAYNNRWGADHEHVTLSQFEDRVAKFKAELMYPHIATSDAKASTNATWLRTLTNRSFHFDQWADEKAFKAAVGPKGEKAIFNGDILPSPAGAASIIGGQESYGMGRGRGGGRGAYRGRAGEKRPRNLDRLNAAPGEQGQTSVVDMSVEHEYSD